LTNKEMMLEAVDIAKTVAGKQKGFKKLIGKMLNKINYYYYKTLKN